MEEKILELYAFASSFEEEKKHQVKFPALAVRKVTEKAQKQGDFIYGYGSGDYEGNGWRYLRTALGTNDEVECIYRDGALGGYCSDFDTAGACVAFRLKFNPKSSVIKSLKFQDFTSVVYEKLINKKITSKNVPIITFGGKEYIWYNREECEEAYARGETIAMDCESLYLEKRAEAFDETGNSNDYAVATKQQKQYERILLENATDEEKAMLCKVRMSSIDNYESLEIIPPETDVQKIIGQIAKQEKIIDEAYTILKDLRQKLALATGNALNLTDKGESNHTDDEAE